MSELVPNTHPEGINIVDHNTKIEKSEQYPEVTIFSWGFDDTSVPIVRVFFKDGRIPIIQLDGEEISVSSKIH